MIQSLIATATGSASKDDSVTSRRFSWYALRNAPGSQPKPGSAAVTTFTKSAMRGARSSFTLAKLRKAAEMRVKQGAENDGPLCFKCSKQFIFRLPRIFGNCCQVDCYRTVGEVGAGR